MPQELVFQSDENEFNKQKEMIFDQIPVVVEKEGDDGYRVVRLISTDPNHYLDPRFVPGNKISF